MSPVTMILYTERINLNLHTHIRMYSGLPNNRYSIMTKPQIPQIHRDHSIEVLINIY